MPAAPRGQGGAYRLLVPRIPRTELGEGFFHITSRGIRRHAIYLDDYDHERHLEMMEAATEKSGWKLHAYCQMTNHFHLVAECTSEELSYGMWLLNGDYAKAFNRRHGYSGHLFERRFYAVAIEAEIHALEVARYVPSNGVRAHVVALPHDYRWSSFRATAGLEPPPPFLTTDWTLGFFGSEKSRASERYVEFVLGGIGKSRPSVLSRQVRVPGTGARPFATVASSPR